MVWQMYFVEDLLKHPEKLNLWIEDLVIKYIEKHKNKPNICTINSIFEKITPKTPEIDIIFTKYTPKRETWLAECKQI
jgi:hypothetical protein